MTIASIENIRATTNYRIERPDSRGYSGSLGRDFAGQTRDTMIRGLGDYRSDLHTHYLKSGADERT